MHETSFVGAGHARGRRRLPTCPAGCRWCPAAGPHAAAGRRRAAHHAAARGPGVARHRGQRAAGRARGRSGRAAGWSSPSSTRGCRTPTATRELHVDLSTSRSRSTTRLPSHARRRPTRPPAHRRARRRPSAGRRDAAAGIGAVPDAALAGLTGPARPAGVDRDVQRRGAGRSNGPARSTAATRSSASFLFGSAELYAWVDGNQRVRMLRTENTNDPGADRPSARR